VTCLNAWDELLAEIGSGEVSGRPSVEQVRNDSVPVNLNPNGTTAFLLMPKPADPVIELVCHLLSCMPKIKQTDAIK